MCHVIVNNADGAEMRSRFWLGSINHRKNNDIIRSPINVFGNGYLTRLVLIDENLAEDLSNHVKKNNNLGIFCLNFMRLIILSVLKLLPLILMIPFGIIGL